MEPKNKDDFFKGCDVKKLIASWVAVFVFGALVCNAILNPIYYHEMKRQERSHKLYMGNQRNKVEKKIDLIRDDIKECRVWYQESKK